MQIIRSLEALDAALGGRRDPGDTLALVPTMGALHAGHLALIKEGKRRATRVAATIFVNPLQFNDSADLQRYPRSEEADLAALEAAGCDFVWLPTPQHLYPDGFATTLHVRGVSDRWEGEHRPGHFDGVATVVAKLLIAVQPDMAIFGEKDWQQLAVIRRMAADLRLRVSIVGYPTVREEDGLAMSSRNALLPTEDRARAVALPRAMNEGSRRILAGEDVQTALGEARNAILSAGFSEVDYVALVDADSLEPLEEAGSNMRLLAAARLGNVRLIDNIPVVFGQQMAR